VVLYAHTTRDAKDDEGFLALVRARGFSVQAVDVADLAAAVPLSVRGRFDTTVYALRLLGRQEEGGAGDRAGGAAGRGEVAEEVASLEKRLRPPRAQRQLGVASSFGGESVPLWAKNALGLLAAFLVAFQASKRTAVLRARAPEPPPARIL
jgi:hypothetical protein